MQTEGVSSSSEKELNNIKDITAVVTELKAELTRLLDPIYEIPNAINKITAAADGLNKSFIGNRARVQEFMTEITNVGPEIQGLGGKFEDAGKTLESVAKASRRNVIASKEDVKELFSTSEILKKDVTTIVDSFAKVGVMYSDISEKVLESINYANSIGVNAKNVMADVLANTDQLSRFNFAGGVQGLTKMAAQASMLRFDMKQTFELADRVLDPDKAIEVASAFQRLGVSAGNLTDPFMLMNQSINDPSGLQDSLINVAKQFTYFDEEAKQFKINPQGILTLREMEQQTGVSAKVMREAALSAADFDKRLGDIKKTGKIAGFSEDDQKLITNLSRMGKGGYEIKVKEDGKDVYKKLADVNEQQLKATLDAEKTKPQNIEEVQRNQLTTQESMAASLKEINEKILRAITGNPTAIKNLSETTKSLREGLKGAADKTDADKTLTNRFEKLSKDLYAAKDDPAKREEIFNNIVETAKQTGTKLIGGAKKVFDELGKGALPISMKSIEGLFKDLKLEKTSPELEKTKPEKGTGGIKINEDFIFGRNKAAESVSTGKTGATGGGVTVNETIEVKPISGKIDINVTATGADSKIIEEILNKGSVTLKERIFEIVAEQSKVTPGRVK
jgi:hypothetical protein